jgi:hypothetical protein
MSTPRIDLSKVKTLGVEGATLNVWYHSGAFRQFENVDLAALKAKADPAGKTIHGYGDQPTLPDDAVWCAWCDERPSVVGVPCHICQSLGADPEHIEEQTGQPAPPIEMPFGPAAHNLVALLGLTPEQAKHLEGASRLNFWRNGCLNIQVQHGSRGVKFACPQATASDADLTMLFLSWGWQHLAPKLYFRPTAESSVWL